jgi:hypothetical protein
VKTPADLVEQFSRSRSDGQFELVPLDWERLQREGLPKIEYLDEPLIPVRSRIWASGPTEAAKSIWAMWKGCQLSREGWRVSFVSMENPLAEDARRLDRLRPEWSFFTLYHHEQQPEVLDLVKPEHVDALVGIATDQDLTILDTFTGCWAGDENSNEAFNAFDRDVMRRVVNETGSAILMTDHTGHPQQFVRREGAENARGASSKGQKCDSFLQFKPRGERAFEITHAKARMGGRKAEPARLKVVDTEDGGIDIVSASGGEDPAIADVATELVAAIEAAGSLTTTALKAAVPRRDQTVLDAMTMLRNEDPPRVQVHENERVQVQGKDGKPRNKRATVWRPAGVSLLEEEEPPTPHPSPPRREPVVEAEAAIPPSAARPPDPTPPVASEEPRPTLSEAALRAVEEERAMGEDDDQVAVTLGELYRGAVLDDAYPEDFAPPVGYPGWTGPILRWCLGEGPRPEEVPAE